MTIQFDPSTLTDNTRRSARLVEASDTLNDRTKRLCKRKLDAMQELPKEPTYPLALRKLHANTRKAIQEGYDRILKANGIITQFRTSLEAKAPTIGPIIEERRATRASLSSLSDILSVKDAPIKAFIKGVYDQGTKPHMEDKFCVVNTENGSFSAVFDGHGGDHAAKDASKFFKENFISYLEQNHGDVEKTLKLLFKNAQEEIEAKDYSMSGTTVAASYIDYATHAIYTATLGDSEIRVYRNGSNGMYAVPLSCVKNWADKEEARRVAKHFNEPEVAKTWPKAQDPQKLRVLGLNVSRALGDCGNPVVSHEPIITVANVEPGDIVLTATDGLWNVVANDEIKRIITLKDLASPEKLVSYALGTAQGSDNITVLASKIV